MAEPIRELASTVIRFGSGVHSNASEDDIDPRECALGENFQLDEQNQELKNRKPFDLIGTVPNAAEIRGFASLQKSDGTVSMLVQAGDTVYEWDGASTFTSVGTVSSSAKLRGRLEANWQLDDKVIITDLELAEEVHEWDGTTFQQTTFTDENDASFGTFRAKYCFVSNERAIFANVHDNGTNTPHLIVGSKRGQFENITVANRPASALAEEDPFFLIQPDYRAINGLAESLGTIITSGFGGSLFQLTGQSAKDFAFSQFFARSGAKGDESVVATGNDVIYGRAGRIESAIGTDRFGDVSSNDLSLPVEDQVTTFDEWTLVYNSRNSRVYCFPTGQSEVWVLHRDLLQNAVQRVPLKSPWSKWTTANSLAFQPTAVMSALDPSDGLEYVFMGDASGRVYRLEGTGESGDAGANDVSVFRLSPLVSMPLDATAYNIEGWIRWRRNEAITAKLRLEYAGENVFNKEIDVSLPAATGAIYYGGGHYYSNDEYYGTQFEDRLTRRIFPIAGGSNEFQLRVTVEGTTDFAISEVGLRILAAS